MSTTLADDLRAAGASRVLTASDDGFAVELSAFNLAFRENPDVVVAAQGPADVEAALAVARASSATVTVLGLGHGVLRDTDGGIAISTRGLASVGLDESARTVRVGAGTSWQTVLDVTTPVGLAPLCGSAPGVGVTGYVLGGGLGPIARSYGFAADHVRSIEIVTPADGLITASADDHADLFWALKGGKGGFGVVIAMTLDLFPIGSVYGGGLYFGAGDARAVVQEFARWSVDLPESVTTSVALLRLPPLPELPEPIRGKFVVHVRFGALADREDAERILAPIRAAGAPLLDAIGELPYAKIGVIHSDPVTPMPAVEGSITLNEFGPDVVDAFLAAAGPDADVPLAAAEVRVLGGKVAEAPTDPNAVGGRDARYNLHIVGAPVPDLLDTVIPEVIGGVFTTMAPWRSQTLLINFVGRANSPEAVDQCWTPEQNARLDAIRAESDPSGLFPFGRGRTVAS